jgi:hypothetical protein
MRRPRIGPCRDPLRLWFLEYVDAAGQVFRRYYADRAEARQALREYRAAHAGVASTKGKGSNPAH